MSQRETHIVEIMTMRPASLLRRCDRYANDRSHAHRPRHRPPRFHCISRHVKRRVSLRPVSTRRDPRQHFCHRRRVRYRNIWTCVYVYTHTHAPRATRS